MTIQDLLYPTPEFIDQYNYFKDLGQQSLANHRICIVGLTRNTESVIMQNIGSLVHLGESAKDYKIVIFENDSSDQTKEIINNLSQFNDNIKLLSEKNNRPMFGSVQDSKRTYALAEYRNKVKQYVQERYENYDFTIVVDTDFQSFSLDGIYNSFGWLNFNDKIGAVCGNSFEYKPIFDSDKPTIWNYDSWAYRGTWWNNLQTHSLPIVTYNPMLWFGLQILPIGSQPFMVNSGFGGMCIYKNRFYFLSDYDGPDCEHVMYHHDLQKKASDFNLFLNPSQIMLLN